MFLSNGLLDSGSFTEILIGPFNHQISNGSGQRGLTNVKLFFLKASLTHKEYFLQSFVCFQFLSDYQVSLILRMNSNIQNPDVNGFWVVRTTSYMIAIMALTRTFLSLTVNCDG